MGGQDDKLNGGGQSSWTFIELILVRGLYTKMGVRVTDKQGGLDDRPFLAYFCL